MERGVSPLPAHFALINRRDGFYLASHGAQPMAMPRYAAHYNQLDWAKINVLDRGAPEETSEAFRRGEGDYIHLQAPGPQLLEEAAVAWTLVSVGASMPEVPSVPSAARASS